MISCRPRLITEHHSVSSVNDLAGEASPCSRHLLLARDQDTISVGVTVRGLVVTNVQGALRRQVTPQVRRSIRLTVAQCANLRRVTWEAR